MLFGRSAVWSWGWSNSAGSTSSGRTGWFRAGLPCSWARHSHRGTRCTRSRRVKRPSPACSRTPGTRAVTRGSRTSLGVVLVAAGVRWLGCAHPRASSPAAAPPKEMTASAVSTVSAEDLHGIPAAQVEELLEGRSAGVQVIRLSSGGISVQIRGRSSIYGDTEPLYVVDGMPVEVTTRHGLSWLNPGDIERLDILKDASATAIYGVRGASRLGGTGTECVPWGSERNQTAEFTGDQPVLRAYIDAAIPPGVLPLIGIEDARGLRRELRLADYYTDGLPAGQWTRVSVPIGQLAMTLQDGRTFDPHRAVTVFFEQWLDDCAPHTLYIDEIAITSGDPRDTTPPPVPRTPRARGLERHIDLAWGPVQAPGLRGYRIEASTDGTRFKAIDVQTSWFNRYVAFLGAPGRRATYRVRAVDVNDTLSAPSETATATTRAMTDDELLTMVQEASFRYYWDGERIPTPGWRSRASPGIPISWRPAPPASASWRSSSGPSAASSPASRAPRACGRSSVFSRPRTGFTASGPTS